jgi:hypothetical protein
MFSVEENKSMYLHSYIIVDIFFINLYFMIIINKWVCSEVEKVENSCCTQPHIHYRTSRQPVSTRELFLTMKLIIRLTLM